MKSTKKTPNPKAFALFVLFITLGIFVTALTFLGLVPDARAQNILSGERLSGHVINIVPTNTTINEERQYRLQISFSHNGITQTLKTVNMYSKLHASIYLGKDCNIFFKNGKIVGPGYTGNLSFISYIAIIFIILEAALVIFMIFTAIKSIQRKKGRSYVSAFYDNSQNRKPAASNSKQYKKYTWYYDKPDYKKESQNADKPDNRRGKVAVENQNNNSDNNINLDAMPDNFISAVKNRSETTACTSEPAAPASSDIKSVVPKNDNAESAKEPTSDTRPANISDHANNVLNEMRAAESAAELDELWAKHSNHMPFSDYISVKREYENIRRNLK